MTRRTDYAPAPADYRATHYSRTGGRGQDHFLRLRPGGTYFWAALDDDERLEQAWGTWEFSARERSIRFDPAPTRGWPTFSVELVLGMETVSLMFLIRPVALCTPNLPLLFYLVGRPGEPEACPSWAHPDAPLDG